jgi:hypothetical protein
LVSCLRKRPEKCRPLSKPTKKKKGPGISPAPFRQPAL